MFRPGNNCCGNEAGLVQKFIGSAYDTVKSVADNLEEIKFIFDFMAKYDVLLCVESLEELKAVNEKSSKFVRWYVEGNGANTYTDYIYVSDDKSGVLPDNPQATGSWVKVNTFLGAGASNAIPWLYNKGSANGGEVNIHVEEDAIGVSEIFINGLRKHLGIGYTYEPVSRTIQLPTPLAKGDQLVAKLIGYPALPNTPNISEFMFVNWVYNNGTAIGGETKLKPPYTFQKVPAVFINGLRKLENHDYVVGYSDYSINLTLPLKTNDVVIVQLGGEPDAFSIDVNTVREALRRTYAEAGLALVDGSFEDGSKITTKQDVVLERKTGKAYNWRGTIPSGGKVIAAGSTPNSAGGIGDDKWVDISNVTLRQPITAQIREALRRSYALAGFKLVSGSFEEGGTLINPNDVLLCELNGNAYSWSGELPKNVASNSSPHTDQKWTNRADRFSRTNALAMGMIGDGVTNDTSAMVSSLQDGMTILFPAGYKFSVDPVVVTNKNITFYLEAGASIEVRQGNSDSGLVFTGANASVKGPGSINSKHVFNAFLVHMRGPDARVCEPTIHYLSKPTYVGDGINIPYNTGALGIDSARAVVRGCTTYNARGAGIYNYRENTTITENKVFDNIAGVALAYGGTPGYGDNCIVSDNIIYNNNVTNAYSGADGILAWKELRGHVISGNVISGSGEHGTYIQSKNCTVKGNVVFGNYASGLKLGGGYGAAVSGNSCYDNNTGNVGDAAEIYMQSPMGSASITGNTTNTKSGNSCLGIRIVQIPSKAIAGEENKLVVASNNVNSPNSMWIYCENQVTVTDNICAGTILLGSGVSDAVTMNSGIISGNQATVLTLTKCSNLRVANNIVYSIDPQSSCFGLDIDGNTITSQYTRINLASFDSFKLNKVKFAGSVAIFEQSSNKQKNSNKEIANNFFDANGTSVLYFTSEGVSGDGLVISGNRVFNASSLFDGYGLGHSITNNAQIGGTVSITHRTGTTSGKSIIALNAMRINSSAAGDVVANNIDRYQ